jgi:sigma-B regulation protein RsbU (phosphoserine phosphatase)
LPITSLNLLTSFMPPEKGKDFQESAALIKTSFKRMFVTLLEQTADRVYIKDTQGRFVFASNALARTHGLKDRKEIKGMSDYDFFDPESAESFFNQEKEILRSGKPVINQIRQESWKNGSTTWSSTSKVPLRLESGEPIGILGISRDVTEEHLSKEQLRKANETMLDDYASAAKVQQVMIPGKIPEIEDLEIAHLWRPMTAVGGDIISFPLNPKNVPLFFIRDVCGHGVQAAFYTILLKYITSQAAENYDCCPQDLLDAVNERISGQINTGFITSLAGHFGKRQPDGSRYLHLSHTGHPQILLYRKSSGQTEFAKMPGSMVMGLPGCKASESIQVHLQPGDRAYTFTDGIIEASDPKGEEFGIERLRAAIENCANQPLQEGLNIIYDTVAEYTEYAQQQDDITLIAFEVAK